MRVLSVLGLVVALAACGQTHPPPLPPAVVEIGRIELPEGWGLMDVSARADDLCFLGYLLLPTGAPALGVTCADASGSTGMMTHEVPDTLWYAAFDTTPSGQFVVAYMTMSGLERTWHVIRIDRDLSLRSDEILIFPPTFGIDPRLRFVSATARWVAFAGLGPGATPEDTVPAVAVCPADDLTRLRVISDSTVGQFVIDDEAVYYPGVFTNGTYRTGFFRVPLPDGEPTLLLESGYSVTDEEDPRQAADVLVHEGREPLLVESQLVGVFPDIDSVVHGLPEEPRCPYHRLITWNGDRIVCLAYDFSLHVFDGVTGTPLGVTPGATYLSLWARYFLAITDDGLIGLVTGDPDGLVIALFQ